MIDQRYYVLLQIKPLEICTDTPKKLRSQFKKDDLLYHLEVPMFV